MSVAIGASAVGARSYTATASQGLLSWPSRVQRRRSGPTVVMTWRTGPSELPSTSGTITPTPWPCATRMDPTLRRDNQEACDMHIQAFALAEELSVPVMVYGWFYPHPRFEGVDIAEASTVDSFLGADAPSPNSVGKTPPHRCDGRP